MLIGLDAPDDAAVMLPPPGMAVVQSVDHFRAFIDDPFVFGQIAAAHALSDLHAMGARPWTALAVAAVPYASGDKMRTELADMLQGATRVLAADGCALVGGHSAEAAEPALGFAVTGLADPGKLLRKSGLRPGDALVLTKPLGTGIVLAGHMRGLARARVAAGGDRLDAARATPPRRGSCASIGARACTDVTGFGLAGHLLEMLRASGVGAVLWLEPCRRCRARWNSRRRAWRARWRRRTAGLVPRCACVPAHGAAVRSADLGRAAWPGLRLSVRRACHSGAAPAGHCRTIVGVVETGRPHCGSPESCLHL